MWGWFKILNAIAFGVFTLIVAPFIGFNITPFTKTLWYIITFVQLGWTEVYWLWFLLTLFLQIRMVRNIVTSDESLDESSYANGLLFLFGTQAIFVVLSILAKLFDNLTVWSGGCEGITIGKNLLYLNIIIVTSAILNLPTVLGWNRERVAKSKGIYCKDCKYLQKPTVKSDILLPSNYPRSRDEKFLCGIKPNIENTFYEPKAVFVLAEERNEYNNCAYFKRNGNSDVRAKLKTTLESSVNTDGWRWALYGVLALVVIAILAHVFKIVDFKELYNKYKDKLFKKKPVPPEVAEAQKQIIKEIKAQFEKGVENEKEV